MRSAFFKSGVLSEDGCMMNLLYRLAPFEFFCAKSGPSAGCIQFCNQTQSSSVNKKCHSKSMMLKSSRFQTHFFAAAAAGAVAVVVVVGVSVGRVSLDRSSGAGGKS